MSKEKDATNNEPTLEQLKSASPADLIRSLAIRLLQPEEQPGEQIRVIDPLAKHGDISLVVELGKRVDYFTPQDVEAASAILATINWESLPPQGYLPEAARWLNKEIALILT
ncbi:hypothetical protein HYU45_00530 [Candidatus Daviesbacteria bacterium]|nr:hypothetical protein [Candidatus Daviesbacteria bacterium]